MLEMIPNTPTGGQLSGFRSSPLPCICGRARLRLLTCSVTAGEPSTEGQAAALPEPLPPSSPPSALPPSEIQRKSTADSALHIEPGPGHRPAGCRWASGTLVAQ